MIRENLDEAIKAFGTLRDRVSAAEKHGLGSAPRASR
jgi:hypothetical protein